MKILVLNPNTSQFVTDKVCDVARQAAGPAEHILGVTGRRGPLIVGTRSECAMAAQEALSLAAEHGGDVDGILLAISFDTGLDALREMLGIPVVGISEAGMLAAMSVSRRFAMLTFGDRAVPIYEELVDHYRWRDRSVGVISMRPLSQDELEDTTLVLPQLVEAIEAAACDRGAESIVLAGAVFAGIAKMLRDRVSIPVVDGIVAAVHQLRMLHAMNLGKPASGSLAYPPAKRLQGMPDSMTRLFRDYSCDRPTWRCSDGHSVRMARISGPLGACAGRDYLDRHVILLQLA